MRFVRQATPESEPESRNSTPEWTPKSEPEPNAAPNAEPVPAWPAAKEEWRGAWELHYIGFGIAFLFLAIWSALALLRARKTPLLVTRRFCYVVHLLLILFGVTRALALFLYPYELVANASGTPVVVQRLLFGIGFPCLNAGFTLIHFAFLEATKVGFSARRIQSLRFITAVIALHVILVLSAEIVTSYVPNTSVLWIICSIYFILCALTVSSSVMYSGINIVRASMSRRQALERVSSGKSPCTLVNRKSNTRKVARVTMVTACLGMACAALHVYAMVGVFKMWSQGITIPEPWPWWSFQSVNRLIELGLAGTMAYTAAQPKLRSTGRQFHLRAPVKRRQKDKPSDVKHTESDLCSDPNPNPNSHTVPKPILTPT